MSYRQFPGRQALNLKLTGEKLFGQRWSLIRQVGLFADQYDAAGEFFMFERCDDLAGGVAGTGDNDSLGHST